MFGDVDVPIRWLEGEGVNQEGRERYTRDKYVSVEDWCTCVVDECPTTLVNFNQLTLHNSTEAPDFNVHVHVPEISYSSRLFINKCHQ